MQTITINVHLDADEIEVLRSFTNSDVLVKAKAQSLQIFLTLELRGLIYETVKAGQYRATTIGDNVIEKLFL